MKKFFTDAPDLHPNLFLGSFQLLFWLFFHPSAWCNFILRLDDTLRPDFTLTDLNQTRWRNPILRRLLAQSFIILPVFISLLVGLTLWLRGAPLDRSLVVPVMYILGINLTLGLMIGSVVNVTAGITGSVTVGLAVGVIGSITEEAAIVPTAIGLAIGAAGSIAAEIDSRRLDHSSAQVAPNSPKKVTSLQTQMGSVVMGVLIGVGVVTLIRLGLTALGDLAVGLTENTAYWLSRAIVVGTSFGLAIGWRRGIITGVTGGVLVGLVYGSAVTGLQTQFFERTGFLIDSGLAGGLASGLLFGTSFGVTVVLPYVLSAHIAGPWAGAWAGALGSWGRHVFRSGLPLWPTLPLGVIGIAWGVTLPWWRPLVLYPFVAAWNLTLYQLDRRRSDHYPSLLRWHSAFWDEFQRLRLNGLEEHLLLVLDRNPEEGQAALEYLRRGRQRWAVQTVQLELEARRLEQMADINALSQAHRTLISGTSDGPANAVLRSFTHLSRDIEAALNQTTAYHQRLALTTIEDHLNSLRRELTASDTPYAVRFDPIAAHWQQLVANHLQKLARAVEQSQEIDNPYIVGVPLTGQQEIFVGRADIVTRIEQLLLDRRRPPVLLYGQRRMGKTSLLRNLGRLLPQTIVPLFVDGQRIFLASDNTDLLYNLAGEMKKSAERQRKLVLPLLNRKTLAANPFTGFNEWLDKVEQALETQEYRTALLALDEFEMLDSALTKGRFDEADVFSMLRHVIQHRPYFKVMLASSHPLEEFRRWASYLINVQVVKIGYLASEEARQLIECPIKDFALRYEPQASQRILELTCGHPALIQLLCCELVTLKNEQSPHLRRLARLQDVEAAIPRALASGSFFFADIEHNQIDEIGLSLLRFLASRGEGAIVSRENLANHLPPGHVDKLEQTLSLLQQRELLEATSDGFRFQVELIRRWFANEAAV